MALIDESICSDVRLSKEAADFLFEILQDVSSDDYASAYKRSQRQWFVENDLGSLCQEIMGQLVNA